jgi:enamine deaminase RidA (YjgF/YER057c/UK114 family)
MATSYINPRGHKSDAVICNGMVFVSGMGPVNNSADIQTQTQEVLGKIDGVLEEAGSDRSRIVSASIWLADIDDYAAFNAVWNDWVVDGRQPTRACIQATLAVRGAVEVAVIAAL